MAMNDPIADFLTRIRNACKAEHRYIDVDWSKIKQYIADILKENGYIENYLVKQESSSRGTMRVFLKYTPMRHSVIQGLRRISKPGLRKYVKHDEIPSFFGGMGLTILSTPQGVIGGAEAKKRKIGGEIICMVW